MTVLPGPSDAGQILTGQDEGLRAFSHSMTVFNAGYPTMSGVSEHQTSELGATMAAGQFMTGPGTGQMTGPVIENNMSAGQSMTGPGTGQGMTGPGGGHKMAAGQDMTGPGTGQAMTGPGSGHKMAAGQGMTGPGTGQAMTGPGSGQEFYTGHQMTGPGIGLWLIDPATGQVLTGPGTDQVTTVPVNSQNMTVTTGQTNIPHNLTLPNSSVHVTPDRNVRVDLNTTYSVLHKGRLMPHSTSNQNMTGRPSNVPPPGGNRNRGRRKRESSSSDSSTDDSSSSRTSPHHYRRGRRDRSPSRRRSRQRSRQRSRHRRSRKSRSHRHRSESRHFRQRRRRTHSKSLSPVSPGSPRRSPLNRDRVLPSTTQQVLASSAPVNYTHTTLTSGAVVQSTSMLNAPRVSALIPQCVHPAATPANPSTRWIQQANGYFAPVNIDQPSQATGVHPERPSSPAISLFAQPDDPLVLEGREVLSTNNLPHSSSGINQIPELFGDNTDKPGDTEHHPPEDNSVGRSENGSEAPEEPHYLASINKVYELIFDTLNEELCPRPIQSVGQAITVTEKVARRREPDRIGRAAARADLRLPVGSTTSSVFESLETVNKPSNLPWKVHKDIAEPKPLEGGRSYRPPVADSTTGLDLSKLPAVDADFGKLNITMPTSSSLAQIPFSMLENWELRERRSIGLANQLDLMAAATLELVWDLADSVPEELRALLIHLSRTTHALSMNAGSSMAEMLRIRRELILSAIQPGFLLETGLNTLKTAPLTSDLLFGGKVQEAITADKEDQLHASLARGNVGPRQGSFKRPAPKPPAQGPASKKAKRSNYFSRRSSIPPPAPNRPSSYQRPPGRGAPKPDNKRSNSSTGKGGSSRSQP